MTAQFDALEKTRNKKFEPPKKPVNKEKSAALGDTCPVLLALLDDFRKFDWAEEYKYPTVTLAQMNQLLAECREDQPVLTP